MIQENFDAHTDSHLKVLSEISAISKTLEIEFWLLGGLDGQLIFYLARLPDHIDMEGCIFGIGIHPNFLGTGLGRSLHSKGLYRLKNEFQAMSYLGMTQVDNIPIRNIMVSNGCI